MATSASATDMILSGVPLGWRRRRCLHGGDLGAARRLFPGAPEPFIDLSTGINPYPYPVAAVFRPRCSRACPIRVALDRARRGRRAQPMARRRRRMWCRRRARRFCCRLSPAWRRPGRAAILAPTYAEHARAAALAGHNVEATSTASSDCGDAELVVVANPNNPDGRLFARSDLLGARQGSAPRAAACSWSTRRSWMSGRAARASPPMSARGNIVVLRSFGKFFGLAGLRLGFALAAPPLAARLAAALGPWAVSGPALAIGAGAGGYGLDRSERAGGLAKASARLDEILAGLALTVVGGTSLFRLVQTPAAPALFHHLGRAGILVRAFTGQCRLAALRPAGERTRMAAAQKLLWSRSGNR